MSRNSREDDASVDVETVDNAEAPADPADERLVAYLDGELDAGENSRVEAELAGDAVARERLRGLSLAWSALDALPRPEAPATFTRSTVEMAAVAVTRPEVERAVGSGSLATAFRKRSVALATIGFLLGVAIPLLLGGAADVRSLRVLPTVLGRDALLQAGSVEFLRALATERPELLETQLDEPLRAAAGEWSRVAQGAVRDRRLWLADQPATRVADLQRATSVWFESPAPQRDALLELSQAIDAAPDAASLRTAAIAHEALVRQLPEGDQAQLRGMPTAERLDAIARQAEAIRRAESLTLTAREKSELRRRIREGLRRGGSLPDILREGLPERVLDQLETHPPRSRAWRETLRQVLSQLPQDDPAEVFATSIDNARLDQLLLLPRDEFNDALDTRSRWRKLAEEFQADGDGRRFRRQPDGRWRRGDRSGPGRPGADRPGGGPPREGWRPPGGPPPPPPGERPPFR